MKLNGQLTKYLPPLPETLDEIPPKQRSFNDQVYDIFRTLYAKELRPYLEAVRNKEAKTGNFHFDRYEASSKIHAHAEKYHITDVAHATLHTISRRLTLL